ncbi:DUF6731 family protein [Carnobacterium maltaromaticum]|uniref:DUF6731 family protein n=1 Tax=Carnobacterium maltaromaticum TaxID=2751 RepID=UPI0039BDA623
MKTLYYNAFLCRNGEKTDYLLYRLIDFISGGEAKERTRILEDNKVIFSSRHRYPEVGRDGDGSRSGNEFIDNNRTAWIGKFNEDKPYAGEIGTDNLEQIVGDLYQPNTCLSISDNFLFIMEYNFLGPSKKQIEKFLSSYIVSNQDDVNYSVKLYEIKKDPMLRLVANSESIKSVTITVNNNGFNLENIFNEGTPLLERLFSGPVEAANEMEVNQTTIVLKKGRRKKEMSVDLIGQILGLIRVNSTELVSAVVEFKNPTTGNMDKFDLKHDGFYTSSIQSNDYTGFEILSDLLTKHYYDDMNRNKDRSYHQYLPLIQPVQGEFRLVFPNDDIQEVSNEE